MDRRRRVAKDISCVGGGMLARYLESLEGERSFETPHSGILSRDVGKMVPIDRFVEK